MKNVCVLLKKGILTEDVAECSLSLLRRNGYAVDELRILSARVAPFSAVQALKEEYDTIFLFAPSDLLPSLREGLRSCFAEEVNAWVYRERECVCILIPIENEELVTKVALPYLQETHGARYENILFRTVGASAERIQALIDGIEEINGGRIRINHWRKYGEDALELRYDDTAPKMAVDDAVRMLAEGLGDTVYAMKDVSLEEQLVDLLKIRGKKLSVAESFTGGGIAKRITSVAGASKVYFEGLNVYHERSKIKRLGVSEYGLQTAGAVSEQTAYEMALGLLNTGECDFSVATTGLAGPKSDRSGLPVGLCFIAIGSKEKVYVYRYQFDGSRREITEKAINYALFQAYKQVKNN